jgi:hypothetical protein
MDDKKRIFTLDYPIGSTVASLYAKLSTEEGLGSWFAERAERDGRTFTFFWQKTPQRADLLAEKENRFVRFRWEDEPDNDAYFEFAIGRQELTGEVTLSITDFAADSEVEDAGHLWDICVKELKRTLGVGQ